MNNAPIGIFDSGMGGLSVWREVRAALPHESLVYYADAANCPYGNRGHDEILRYVKDAVAQMIGRGVKMMVIACNTATAAAINYLRETYPGVPFVGMEPAVKPAVLNSKTGVIGVLATRSSLDGGHFKRTSAEFADRAEILTAVGEGWVDLVERDLEHTPEALESVYRVVEPLLTNGADRLVLGCTHYPFLEDSILEVIGTRDVRIIDSATAIVRRVKELLSSGGLEASASNIPQYMFLTSGGGEDYVARLEKKVNYKTV